jgi:hypothetical protein
MATASRALSLSLRKQVRRRHREVVEHVADGGSLGRIISPVCREPPALHLAPGPGLFRRRSATGATVNDCPAESLGWRVR